MKILHVDETFHPSFGYQINSLAKFQSKQGHEVAIITTDEKHLHPAFKFANDNDQVLINDKKYEQTSGVTVHRVLTKRFVSGRAIYTHDLFRLIDELQPDVVMLHQIEVYASAMYILKGYHKKYPTIADSHMLKMASRNRLSRVFNFAFRKLITPKLKKNQIPVIRTQDDDYVNTVLGLPLSLTPFVSFGSDLDLFHPDGEVKAAFRRERDIPPDAFVIVYTGKMDDAKGGLLLAETCRDAFTDKKGRAVYCLIVGNTYDAYGEKVEKAFSESANHILRFQTQRYVDLPRFYQAADLCVFAKQCSLSFYDAQACGLPVVFEDNNINIERASHENGMTFKAGSVQDFREKIQTFIDMDPADFKGYSDRAVEFVKNSYGYDKIAEQYSGIMQEAIDRFHHN